MVAERQRKRAPIRPVQTFKELAEDYMTNGAVTLKSRPEIQRYLDGHSAPLRALRIEEVTGAVIVVLTEKIAKRGAHAVARRAFESIMLIFGN